MPRPSSYWPVLIAVWACCAAPLPAAPAPARGASTAPARSTLQTQYRKAMAHFRAGRVREASAIFTSILNAHPDHEASRVYLAKSYFRMDRLEEAYQQFRTLNPRTLDPETSYEYARTFYDKEQYEEALNTFAQVPDGHGLYDLASYYGAISALKLKRYREAEALINKAVVLPSRLVRTRNLYRAHIQQLLLKEEEEYLTREKAAEERRLREQTRVFREKLAEEAPAKKELPALPAPATEHGGFYTLVKGAEAGFVNKRQLVDYSRISTEDNTQHTNFFKFQNGFYGLSQRRDRKPHAGWGLGLGFTVEDRNYSGFERIIDPSPDDVMRLQTFEGNGRGNQKIASGHVELWYERAVAAQTWTGVRLAGLGLYPDFKSGTSRTNRSIEWFIGKRGDWSEYRLVLDGVQSVDARGKPSVVTQEQHIEGMWTVPSGFGVLMAARAQQLRYPEPDLRMGPERTGRIKAQMFSDFPIGVRVGLEGRMQQSQGYRSPLLPDFVFNEESVSFVAFIHVKPLQWLDIHIAGGREQRSAKDIEQRSGAPVDEATRVYTVKQKHYDFVSESSVSVSANLLF